MAQVVRPTAAEIDFLLSTLFDEWQDVTELAHQWPTLDAAEKEDFQLEWTLTEERLERMQVIASHGLTAAQWDRYRELLKLVAQNRPILETLLRV